MKVISADSSAIPTANGATSFRRVPPEDSASDGSNDGADVSAVVIPAIGELKTILVRLPRTDAFISQCCRIATIPRRTAVELLRPLGSLGFVWPTLTNRRSDRPEYPDP